MSTWYLPGDKGLTTFVDCLEHVGDSTSHRSVGFHTLLLGQPCLLPATNKTKDANARCLVPVWKHKRTPSAWVSRREVGNGGHS
jgi:hypothetical protein